MVEDKAEEKEGMERRELCPYCSKPLMKSRRMKFQGGEWRCAHCGAPYTGTLDFDEDEVIPDLGDEEETTENSPVTGADATDQ